MRSPIKFVRSATWGRIMSLMILVAFSAVAMWSAKKATEFYQFRKISEQRMSMAVMQGKLGEIMERAAPPATDPIYKALAAETIRHHRDLEQKYRKGVTEPKMTLQPDPPEPPFPLDLDQIRREGIAIGKRVSRFRSDFEKRNSKTKAENNSFKEKPDVF